MVLAKILYFKDGGASTLDGMATLKSIAPLEVQDFHKNLSYLVRYS